MTREELIEAFERARTPQALDVYVSVLLAYQDETEDASVPFLLSALRPYRALLSEHLTRAREQETRERAHQVWAAQYRRKDGSLPSNLGELREQEDYLRRTNEYLEATEKYRKTRTITLLLLQAWAASDRRPRQHHVSIVQ